MTFQELKDIITTHNIPEDVHLASDSGWECSATDMDGVFYNRKDNIIVFTQDKWYATEYLENDDWECVNVANDEKNAFYIKRFSAKSRNFDRLEVEKYDELVRFLDNNKNAVTPKKLGLKLLVFSEPKNYFIHNEELLKKHVEAAGDYDLCIWIGDIQFQELEQLLRYVPEEKIQVVPKDLHFNEAEKILTEQDFGITYEQVRKYEKIIDRHNFSCSIHAHNGIHLVGFGGSFTYNEENMPYRSQSESLWTSELLLLHKGADVLISYDGIFPNPHADLSHGGLIGITHYIYSNQVQWHIHASKDKSYEGVYDNGTREKGVCLCECIEI